MDDNHPPLIIKIGIINDFVINLRWKSTRQRKQFWRFKNAADVIRRSVQSRKNKKNFLFAMATVVEEAQMDRKKKVLMEKLALPPSHDLLRESSE